MLPAMLGMRVGRTREKSQRVRSAPARRAGSGMLGCLNVLNKAYGDVHQPSGSGNSGRHADRVQKCVRELRGNRRLLLHVE